MCAIAFYTCVILCNLIYAAASESPKSESMYTCVHGKGDDKENEVKCSYNMMLLAHLTSRRRSDEGVEVWINCSTNYPQCTWFWSWLFQLQHTYLGEPTHGVEKRSFDQHLRIHIHYDEPTISQLPASKSDLLKVTYNVIMLQLMFFKGPYQYFLACLISDSLKKSNLSGSGECITTSSSGYESTLSSRLVDLVCVHMC